ncbi:YceI family protein [Kineosporia rhizophila]|uniref:YceI family protein n=1 Tax=Kineosporia TaxID=49184 RepID=UPI001E4C31AF|nr:MULTISPECIES: YceI family protein [Kineosporia]MCE0536946.1 YceI family protein [Kineosporia rhizophila]GLY19102.1 polyisoprenoid-binding protein [Kineosporia sp. NBRC 101677]
MSNFPAELTGTWVIDAGHSTVGFAVKHAMVSTTRGKFNSFSGEATIDAANPEASSAFIEIDATSVDTGSEQRDGHLRSPDFWDAENNPKITFRSTSAKLDGDDLILTGDLTIKGITKPVDIKWEFTGVGSDPWGTTKAGFEGTATINRGDWGVSWNAALETGGFLVSDKVKLVLEIEADKKQA